MNKFFEMSQNFIVNFMQNFSNASHTTLPGASVPAIQFRYILVLPMREMSYGYQYRLIRKLRSLGFIGIGRYEKKLIGCTLLWAKAFFIKECYFNSSIQTQAIYKFFKNIAIKFLPHFAKNLTLPTLFFTSIYAMMTVAK